MLQSQKMKCLVLSRYPHSDPYYISDRNVIASTLAGALKTYFYLIAATRCQTNLVMKFYLYAETLLSVAFQYPTVLIFQMPSKGNQ